MEHNEAVQCAYVAGILDGEGFIGAIKRNPSTANKMVSPKYSIRVSVMMCDEGPIRAVARLIGAEHNVYLRRRPRVKPIWVIDLESHRAYDLLQMTMPFLIGKKEQAQRVCDLYNLLATSAQFLTKPGRPGPAFHGGHKKNFSLSDEFIGRCNDLFREILRT